MHLYERRESDLEPKLWPGADLDSQTIVEGREPAA